MLKVILLLFLIINISKCAHEKYFKGGEECLTNFECRSTACCRDYKCVESSECKNDVLNTYMSVGIIAVVFLILVIAYFVKSVQDTRKSVNEIQNLNSAIAKQQKKDEQTSKIQIKSNSKNINNHQIDNVKTQ